MIKTTTIRTEYVAPRLIPRRYKGNGDSIHVDFVTFGVEEIAPHLFNSLFQSRPADALVLTRRRWLTRAERDEIKETTGKTRLFSDTVYYRVIAYKGKPMTCGEYTELSDALRDAVNQVEQPEQETETNV